MKKSINDITLFRYLFNLDNRNLPASIINWYKNVGSVVDSDRENAIKELAFLKGDCRNLVVFSKTFVDAMDKSYMKFTQFHMDILEELDRENGIVRSPYFTEGCYVVYSIKNGCLTLWVFHDAIDKFLSKYDDEREQLIKEIKILKKIEEQKLSRIGPRTCYIDGEGVFECGCYIGDRYYEKFYTKHEEYDKAIQYGYNFYGKEFMDEVIEKDLIMYKNSSANNYNDDLMSPTANVHYYAGETEISEEMYNEFNEMRKSLTKIRNAENPLNRGIAKTNSIKR